MNGGHAPVNRRSGTPAQCGTAARRVKDCIAPSRTGNREVPRSPAPGYRHGAGPRSWFAPFRTRTAATRKAIDSGRTRMRQHPTFAGGGCCARTTTALRPRGLAVPHPVRDQPHVTISLAVSGSRPRPSTPDIEQPPEAPVLRRPLESALPQ